MPTVDSLMSPHPAAADRQFARSLARLLLLASAFVRAFSADAETHYRKPAEMYADMQAIAAAHPDICEVVDFGDSYLKTTGGGGFDLLAMRITRRSVAGPKPVFFLGANIHGREIATAEIAMMFLQWLCDGYGRNPDATWLVDWQETWIAPVLNPDGRDGLLWVNARGVDINRNFGFQWGLDTGSTSADRGAEPFSEPETQGLRDLFRSLFSDQRGPGEEDRAPLNTTGLVIQLHSNGQQTFWPWGYGTNDVPNAPEFRKIASKWRARDGYFIGPLCASLFPVSGMLDDWVYGELGVPSFLREVLDPGWYVEPPYPAVEKEFWEFSRASFLEAAKLARMPYSLVEGPDVTDIRWRAAEGVAVMVSAVLEESATGRQPIAGGEFYVDLPPWAEGAVPLPAIASDGSFDQTMEKVEISISRAVLSASRHLLYVQGCDAEGNWGPVSAQFLATPPTHTPASQWSRVGLGQVVPAGQSA